MNHLTLWIQTPFAQALGWTLLHFVWEGAVLAMMLGAGLWLMRAAPARHRYVLACTILAAMAVAFAGTLAVTWSHQPTPVALVPMTGPLADVPAASDTVQAAAHSTRLSVAAILNHLAWLVPLWMVGVTFFYARGVAGWIAVQRLRQRGVCSPPPEWQARLDGLAARLRLSRPVALLESCLADTPVLIGYLRPVILLPLGCMTGFSASQVECILLHELAHVRRHDYVVNLLQSVVEGLLFYHPAVWWASRVVRAERENCCDDAVVELLGDARSYAATLATLEQRRVPASQAALAATGGNLMKRIRRLTVEPRGARTLVVPGASAGILVVLFAAGLLGLPAKITAPHRSRMAAPVAGVALQVPVPARKSQSPADPKPQAELATPYRKWLNEDVAYIITDEERAAFKVLQSDQEHETFIENFWLRRDPTPNTVQNEFKEEHYRRIAYANEHFASAIPGWKTDRGRIYITYGPPDEIEDHSSGGNYQRPAEEGGGQTSTYPFQKWRYRFIEGVGTNVIIEFVDPDRSGEFHMTMDPAEKEALVALTKPPQDSRVFVSSDALAISVVVPKRNHSVAAPSTMVKNQILLINLERTIADENAKLQELRRKYRPGHPDVLAEKDAIKVLEEQWDSMLAEAEDRSPVTFLVPIDASAVSHVSGQVTTLNNRIVASFDAIDTARPALAKTLSLRVGTYRLTVVVKNTATGDMRTSVLDFTVD